MRPARFNAFLRELGVKTIPTDMCLVFLRPMESLNGGALRSGALLATQGIYLVPGFGD